jgi:Bacterial extracellular solute-binding protein
MDLRRLIGPAFAAVLLGAIGGGIWYSHSNVQAERDAAAARQAEAAQEIQVRGLIGSEKEPLFADAEVQAVLARHHVTVHVEKAGSRDIARRFEPQHFDFGFPSGAPAAAALKVVAKPTETYSPFYTPIVIASWRPIAQILVADHIVSERDGNYFVTDMPALLDLMKRHARWKDLAGNTSFTTNKAVLLSSTDVRTSNSAAMYLSLASYLENGQSVIESQEQVDRVLPFMTELFMRQGFQESSSAAPFEDYLALGMGKTPLLVAYESQMVAFWLAHPERPKDDMVVLYPIPTVFSKHVLIPFNEKGKRLGALLERDPELQSLAHQYGFRTGGSVKGPELWSQHGIHTPSTIVDVVDPPSYEWLEKMITAIEQKFQ